MVPPLICVLIDWICVVLLYTRPSRLVIASPMLVTDDFEPSALVIELVLPAMSVVFCATAVLTLPSAESTLAKPAPTSAAAPEVPPIVFAFDSA